MGNHPIATQGRSSIPIQSQAHFLHDGVATEVVPGEAFYRSQQRKQQPPPQQQTLT